MKNIGKITDAETSLKLDLKDRKILSLLMLDARITLSDISKKVNLSKSNIARRISQMEKDGFITGYHAYIDVSKIGLNTTLVFLKIRATQTEKEEFLKTMAIKSEIYAEVEIIGEFDIILGFYSNRESERDLLLDDILKEKIIKNFEICDIKTSFPKMNYTEEMFINIHDEKMQLINYETDKKDLMILKALSKNSRISSVDLAKSLALPRATINYRIRKMIQAGILAKFQPNVNFFMLDTEFYFLRFKLSKPSERGKLKKYLAQSLRANTIIESNGTYQIMAFLQFKNNAEFRKFEEDLLKKFERFLQDYSFSLAKSQHKLDWFPENFDKLGI